MSRLGSFKLFPSQTADRASPQMLLGTECSQPPTARGKESAPPRSCEARPGLSQQKHEQASEPPPPREKGPPPSHSAHSARPRGGRGGRLHALTPSHAVENYFQKHGFCFVMKLLDLEKCFSGHKIWAGSRERGVKFYSIEHVADTLSTGEPRPRPMPPVSRRHVNPGPVSCRP